MELKIIDKKDNPLFNRKEIEASISAEVTPDKQAVRKLISEKLSAIPEAIKLKGIHGKFGSKNFTIRANVYDSIEDKEKIEPKSKKEKEEEKKAAETNIAKDKETVNNSQKDDKSDEGLKTENQSEPSGGAKEETPQEKPKQKEAPAEQKPEEPVQENREDIEKDAKES